MECGAPSTSGKFCSECGHALGAAHLPVAATPAPPPRKKQPKFADFVLWSAGAIALVVATVYVRQWEKQHERPPEQEPHPAVTSEGKTFMVPGYAKIRIDTGVMPVPRLFALPKCALKRGDTVYIWEHELKTERGMTFFLVEKEPCKGWVQDIRLLAATEVVN